MLSSEAAMIGSQKKQEELFCCGVSLEKRVPHNHHGFKRSRWRGLWRQRIQDYMIAVCRNLRILAKNLIPDRAAAQFRAMASSFSAYFFSLKPKFHCIFNLQLTGFGIFGI